MRASLQIRVVTLRAVIRSLTVPTVRAIVGGFPGVTDSSTIPLPPGSKIGVQPFVLGQQEDTLLPEGVGLVFMEDLRMRFPH